MWLADPAAKLRVVLQKNQGETSWESQTLRYVVFSGAFDKMINMWRKGQNFYLFIQEICYNGIGF